MFENVLKTRMRFFHVCPVGRILNRFSSDMALVDAQLNKALGYVTLVSNRNDLCNSWLVPRIIVTISVCTKIYSIGFSHLHM